MQLLTIKITELADEDIPQAKALVARVFPYQDFTERISFWAHRHRRNPVMRLILKIYGMEVSQYWVAVDETGEICGTTGLYSEKDDISEALWLSWFCVAPEKRGLGIGKMLLEFSIKTAKDQNKKYLRLYTSDDPGEAAAQPLYEKYGFKITKKEKAKDHVLIYREKNLDEAESGIVE